jgi:PAS domain S-box-containing protein
MITDRAGALVFAEGSALPAFGVGPEDVGKPVSVAAAAVPAVDEGCRRSLAGQSHTDEVKVGGASFSLRFSPLREGARKATGAIVLALERPESTVERLERSEERLADAQRVAHVGSWEWDIGPNVVTWSDEMHRIYGIEPGQFGGTYEGFLERVHADDKEYTQSVVLEAYRTSKPFVYDHRIVRPQGEVRMLHTRGDVVTDEQGKALRLVGSCWDVTEKWEAEQNLERSVSLLRASLESTADGILVVDLEGRVSAFNQQLLDLWGLSPADVEHNSFDTLLALVHEQLEDGEACLRRVIELRSQPAAESFDSLHFHNGRAFERYSRPQRIGDDIVGRVWSYRDVTDREGLLRRTVFLSDATRLLTSLDVEAALEGVARLALPTMADACAVDLFAEAGGPRRLLSISLDPSKALHGELPHQVFEDEPMMTTTATSSTVVVPVTSRGTILGALTFGHFGERQYSPADLALFQELAGRAALSIENALLYRRASDALAARDEFLSIAAHEIRGPLTALHLAAQGLQGEPADSRNRIKMLQIIQNEDRRLARFVDELLDVGRVRAGGLHFDLAPVDLAEVVRESVGSLTAQVTRSRSSLAVTMTGAVLGIWDRARLEQVVTNLLSNAIKFGLGRPIEVVVSQSNGLARLSVRDHGIGIPFDRRERIFEPFERAVSNRHYGGLGLGLYIVRRIVEGLGGTVTVQSEPSAGATFIVELPQGQLAQVPHDEAQEEHPAV